jgi:phosphotriesterase-related protein
VLIHEHVHDAGWYAPSNPTADPLPSSYTVLFRELMSKLSKQGFTKKDWRQLLVENPAEVLAIRVRLP